MQVILTPLNPEDSPMTFELEDGGSLSLGGLESQAQLSWDLLEDHFRIKLRRDAERLMLEKEEGVVVEIDQEPANSGVVLISGQVLTLGKLQCRLSAHLPESKEELEGGDDDIFNAAISEPIVASTVSMPAKAASGRWLFKVLTGPNSGAQLNLEEGKPYIVGSDASSCDIVLVDLSVSKQHLKITVFASGEMVVEDLKSRNGVLINGEKIEERSKQSSSAIVTAGATTFMIVDRTGEQKTIVTQTPPVKERAVIEAAPEPARDFSAAQPKEPSSAPTQKSAKWSIVAIAASLLLGIGFGIYFLSRPQPTSLTQIQPAQLQEINALLEQYPYFEQQFNQASGVLTLSGHILTEKDRRQLMSKLAQISLIRRIDDTNLVVDELVWQEFNMALEKRFKGVSLTAVTPGEFLLTGTLKEASQAENLIRYLQMNFPYNEHLQNHIVVLEQLIVSVNEKLQAMAPGELVAELSSGELLLAGTLPSTYSQEFHTLVEQLKSTPGIRSVRNLVIEQTASDDSGMIDISPNYRVTGFSKASDANTSVMINGRILHRGDQIDGMTITSIRPQLVVLERGGIKYRINYSS